MYQQAANLLKELFVDVAGQDYGLRGRPTNTSRVALLTGLDRGPDAPALCVRASGAMPKAVGVEPDAAVSSWRLTTQDKGEPS